MLKPKRNIFLIARTKDGKTTLAKLLSEKLKCSTISASSWIASVFMGVPHEIDDPESRAEKLSKVSIEKLRDDPDACVSMISSNPSFTAGNCIIEGIRNPRDFSILFDPRKDIVVRLRVDENQRAYSTFEESGISAIDAILCWYEQCELTDLSRIINIRIESREKLESVADGLARIL